MKYKAHDYQDFCTAYIKGHPISALFLDCGLGKTIITLTAINDLLFDSFQISRVLVIAPKRVAKHTWKNEIEKWEHLKNLKYSIVVGTAEQRKRALLTQADIYIVNRENVAWLVESGLFHFDMLVIDELSSFKSYRAQRFKALKKVRPTVSRVVGLTGTPASNGLMDLFAEIGILDMGERLGRFIGKYRERYFLPDKRNGNIIYSYKPKEGAEEAIFKKLSDICISMKSEDFLEMPDLVINDIKVDLDEKETALYKKLKRDLILPFLDGDIDAKTSAGLSLKLHQMANGAVYDENGSVKVIHDKKIEALEDLIEAANGKPVLIAYWFKHDLERIKKAFPVRTIDTDKDIDDWNMGKIPLACIHPASAGHGLNLQQGGSTLVWFSLTWSLELYQQMNARLNRQGQKETVVIHHLIAKGTIDEKILQMLQKKDDTQNALIDAVKAEILEVGYDNTGVPFTGI